MKKCFYFKILDKNKNWIGNGYFSKKYFEKTVEEVIKSGFTIDITKIEENGLYVDDYMIIIF